MSPTWKAKLEKCLNNLPGMLALIDSWAPGPNWQPWYQLELVTSIPRQGQAEAGAKARQMQDIWMAALGPGLSASLSPTRYCILRQKVCCLEAKCSFREEPGAEGAAGVRLSRPPIAS